MHSCACFAIRRVDREGAQPLALEVMMFRAEKGREKRLSPHSRARRRPSRPRDIHPERERRPIRESRHAQSHRFARGRRLIILAVAD